MLIQEKTGIVVSCGETNHYLPTSINARDLAISEMVGRPTRSEDIDCIENGAAKPTPFTRPPKLVNSEISTIWIFIQFTILTNITGHL
jgi:hypothetical protein